MLYSRLKPMLETQPSIQANVIHDSATGKRASAHPSVDFEGAAIQFYILTSH